MAASEVSEKEASLQGTILTKLSFHGTGKFTVARNRIVCSEEIEVEVEKTGDKSELKITGGPGAGASWSNSYISGSAISVGSGGGTCVMNGMTVSDIGKGRAKINGVRYAPYTVRTGPCAGKKVYVPDGYALSEPGGEVKAAEAIPKGCYSFDISKSAVSLWYVATSGACAVAFEGDTLFSPQRLSIHCSGASSVAVSATHRIDHLTVECSGVSSVKFPAIAKSMNLGTSGTSKISGPHGIEDVTVDSSGVSNINVTAEPRATVSRETSGMSEANVGKKHI
jgi:hypothetical protein